MSATPFRRISSRNWGLFTVVVTRDGATGGAWGQELRKNSLSPPPPSAIEFSKIAMHCWHFRNLLAMFLEGFSNFEPIRKVWSVKILLASLAVGTLTIFAPQHFFPVTISAVKKSTVEIYLFALPSYILYLLINQKQEYCHFKLCPCPKISKFPGMSSLEALYMRPDMELRTT